jgi:hypothetical protein
MMGFYLVSVLIFVFNVWEILNPTRLRGRQVENDGKGWDTNRENLTFRNIQKFGLFKRLV